MCIIISAIAFFLSIPGIFPFAQTWIHDDEPGRAQITADRKKFNSFVNEQHAKQLTEKTMAVRTVQVSMRDGVLVDLHLYQSTQLANKPAAALR